MPHSIHVNDAQEIDVIHTSGATPEGYVEITDAQYQEVLNIRANLVATGRQPTVLWDGAGPVAPADTRPRIAVTVDGQTGSLVRLVGSQIQVEITTSDLPDMDLVIPVFGRQFLFTFAGGVASKTITLTQSGVFNIHSNSDFLVETPIDLTAAE